MRPRVRRNHDLASGMHEVKVIEATSFGGSHPAKTARVRALQVGSITITEPVVRLNPVRYGDANVFSGNLGTTFFKHFKVTFDLPHDRFMLEPADNSPQLPASSRGEVNIERPACFFLGQSQ
jgi:hypothetical protein